MEVRDVHEDDGEGLGIGAGVVPYCTAAHGNGARHNRLFLEAMRYFSVGNIFWRALPERFGNWNSVWRRFDQLREAGVIEIFFDYRVRPCLANRGKKGQKVQALGRSRRGFFTRIHLKTDFDDHLITFNLAGCEKVNASHFPMSIRGCPLRTRDIPARPADKQRARAASFPVIPRKANEEGKPGSLQNRLQELRLYRASRWQIQMLQMLQAGRVMLGEGKAKRRIHRRTRGQFHLGPIPQYGLGFILILKG